MSAQTRRGLALLAAASGLGVFGDLLLRATPLGLNVLLWTGAFMVALAGLLRYLRAPLHHGRRWMIGPLLVFAGLFVWRASQWLQGLDLLAIAVLVSLGAVRESAVRAHVAGLGEYARAVGRTSVSAIVGFLVLLVEDVKWREVSPRGRSAELAAVGRGLVFAAPLVIVFAALFIAADAVFKSLLQALAPDLSHMLPHLAAIVLFGWASAGLLRGLLAPEEELAPFAAPAKEPRISLGAVEVGVVLAALDLLFLTFVLVQFRYLFGGSAHVEAQTGLTYAEYARHGFFELVAVAALALPVVLLADWTLRRGSHERICRALTLVLVALLFVVMASAMQRMRLYQRVYGLTELRLYTTGFMLWLGVVFAWLTATVLRGRRRRFAVGALVSGLAAIVFANALNPDALIARTNLNRRHVDVAYVATLSDDAVPTLVERLPQLPAALRVPLARELAKREHATTDWRTFNLGRDRASEVLQSHQAELRRLAHSP